MKDICLVVPTDRESCIKDFIKKWDKIGLFNCVDFYLIEDNKNKTFNLTEYEHKIKKHFCWEDIVSKLGNNSWIIPRKSDAIRSFGYLMSYLDGYKFTLTLDDDCYPCNEIDGVVYDGQGFVNAHFDNLTETNKWFNTLSKTTPKGLPYYNKGVMSNIVLSHGLWTNNLDYDASHQLMNNEKEELTYDTRIIPFGQFFPMCGMNLMWSNEISVLMYHLLMGSYIFDEHQLNPVNLPFDRFGDIWCGIILKKICDEFKFNISTGMPYVRHNKESDPFVNLKKEASGIEVNEIFWEHIDKFEVDFRSGDLNGAALAYEDMACHIGNFVNEYPKFLEYHYYFDILSKAMKIWAKLFMVK